MKSSIYPFTDSPIAFSKNSKSEATLALAT